MAVLELSRANYPEFERRIRAIASVEQRKWGKLTPEGVLRHLRTSVEISLGEGPKAPNFSVPGLRVLVRKLFFEWFTTWPGGWMKAPASFTPAPEGDLAFERDALLAILNRYLDTAEREPDRLGPNALLGPTPLRAYGPVHGVHFAHHFRQYGV